jgi:hypothetical protein
VRSFGGLAHDLAEHRIGGIASPLVFLQRHVGHVAESAPPPLHGDDRRLPVIVGWRQWRL